MSQLSGPGDRSSDPENGHQPASQNGRLGAVGALELWPLAARMGIVASLRAAGRATSSSLGVTRRLAVAVRRRESPATLLSEARRQAVHAARDALGVTELEWTLDRIASTSPRGDALRQRGEELIADSASVDEDDDRHPAFGVILEELAPDEVRLLRVLVTQGDTAYMDVCSVPPWGGRGRMVARRLTLLPGLAGCRHPDRIQLYLENLLRLSLIDVREEPIESEQSYDVLAGDPDFVAAKEKASDAPRRAKTVRGRITLTDFGRSFCETCLPF